MTEELRDKEHVILQQIESGNDDVQKITSATTLENHHVTYAFEKLEGVGFLEVSKPEGTVERVVDGQKRVFQAPKKAELTGKGEEYLEDSGTESVAMYEDLSRGELVERVRDLENRVDGLEKKFNVFREQVQRSLK